MSWKSLLLKMDSLPTTKDAILVQLRFPALMDAFVRFVEEKRPTQNSMKVISLIQEMEDDLSKAGRRIQNLDYLNEMVEEGVISRRDLLANLNKLWHIKDVLTEIRSEVYAVSGSKGVKIDFDDLLFELSEDEWPKATNKPELLNKLKQGLKDTRRQSSIKGDLRKEFQHLIPDLIKLGFHEIKYRVQTVDDASMNAYNTKVGEQFAYTEGVNNWFRYAPFTGDTKKRMKNEQDRLEKNHPAIGNIKLLPAKSSEITEVFELRGHGEEVEGKLQQRTSKEYKINTLTDDKVKDFLVHVVELDSQFMRRPSENKEMMSNFKIAGIIRTKGDNRVDFLFNYVDMLFDMDSSDIKELLNRILKNLGDLRLTYEHSKIDWATEYARKILGKEEIGSRTDFKNLPEGEREGIISEMEGSDFLKDKMGRVKSVSIGQQFLQKDDMYELKPEAKKAFKVFFERATEEGLLEEFDINGPFDEETKEDIVELFEKEEGEYLEDLGQDRALEQLSKIPFDESKFSTDLEKKLAGIIYHLLYQGKPVKETLIGGTSEIFKFFKMVYQILNLSDEGKGDLDKSLDSFKEGDFDFELNPPYVDEIKSLSNLLEGSTNKVKRVFYDKLVTPSLEEFIEAPYLYQEETINELLDKQIISEVGE
jgi:hypothetical protein